jgi:hypothetical protein
MKKSTPSTASTSKEEQRFSRHEKTNLLVKQKIELIEERRAEWIQKKAALSMTGALTSFFNTK